MQNYSSNHDLYLDRELLKIDKEITLSFERTHEVFGNSRRNFALWVGTKISGPIIWIRPNWLSDQLFPDGIISWINPGRVITISTGHSNESLWAAEEALRSGVTKLVVLEVNTHPTLKSVQRLNLAAETGKKEKNNLAICLMLTPENGGVQGVESRWSMTMWHSSGNSKWKLTSCKSRYIPLTTWKVQNFTKRQFLVTKLKM